MGHCMKFFFFFNLLSFEAVRALCKTYTFYRLSLLFSYTFFPELCSGHCMIDS